MKRKKQLLTGVLADWRESMIIMFIIKNALTSDLKLK